MKKVFYKERLKTGERHLYVLGRKIFSYRVKKIIDRYGITSDHYGNRYIYTGEPGNQVILKTLKQGKPCFITRFGGTELRTVAYFVEHNQEDHVTFSEIIKRDMKVMSGFFSPSDEQLTRFSCETINMIQEMDVVGIFHYHMPIERELLDRYGPRAAFVTLGCIGDYVGLSKDPWTQYLKGKRVLVIHPFGETIRQQYAKRHLLFQDERHLPDFELDVMSPVQGLGDARGVHGFKDWFEALEGMYREIDQRTFDVALIGAGAYGMFLGHYVKKSGRQAVHIGGATQLLFGIRGRRWEETYDPDFGRALFNEHWVRPSAEETPQELTEFEKLEGIAAYW
jgi:hypothetical protein